MQPITREIIDRRQPAIRWSAVLAGTAVAVGLWGVFQLLGVGAGLAALDPDDVRSAKGAAIGMGVWSVLSPLIATFVGGFIAARLANTYDKRNAAAHGLVVWGLTTAAGILVTLGMASAAAIGAAHSQPDTMAHRNIGADDARLFRDAEEAIAPINTRLAEAGKPEISPNALIAAARAANTDDGFDADKFIDKLDDRTALDKAGATEVANQLGPRASALIQRVPLATSHEREALQAAESTGHGLLALAIAMLLSIGTAILGAMLALRNIFRGERNDRDLRPHTTAPYPVTTVVDPPVYPATPER